MQKVLTFSRAHNDSKASTRARRNRISDVGRTRTGSKNNCCFPAGPLQCRVRSGQDACCDAATDCRSRFLVFRVAVHAQFHDDNCDDCCYNFSFAIRTVRMKRTFLFSTVY